MNAEKFFLEIQELKNKFSSQIDEATIKLVEARPAFNEQEIDPFDLSKLPFSSIPQLKANHW